MLWPWLRRGASGPRSCCIDQALRPESFRPRQAGLLQKGQKGKAFVGPKYSEYSFLATFVFIPSFEVCIRLCARHLVGESVRTVLDIMHHAIAHFVRR